MTADRRRWSLAAGLVIAGGLVRRARHPQRRGPAPSRTQQEEREAELAQLIRQEHDPRRKPTLKDRKPTLNERWPLWDAVLSSLIGVVPVLLLTEVSYLRFHDVPREQAVVISQTEWTAGPRDCRAFDKQVIVAFRVDHPRPGFPAGFSRLECPSSLDEKVGEVVLVARKDATVWPRVDVDPVGNQLYALLFPLAIGVLFFAVMYAVLWLASRLNAARRP